MNNTEIASRIRKILYYANEIRDNTGRIDFATSHCIMIEYLTDLLLDIVKAPKI